MHLDEARSFRRAFPAHFFLECLEIDLHAIEHRAPVARQCRQRYRLLNFPVAGAESLGVLGVAPDAVGAWIWADTASEISALTFGESAVSSLSSSAFTSAHAPATPALGNWPMNDGTPPIVACMSLIAAS